MIPWSSMFAGGRGVTLLLGISSHGGMRVAAVLFRKSYGWGPQSAAAYLEEHGLRHSAMSESGSSFRFAQTLEAMKSTVEYGNPDVRAEECRTRTGG